MADGQLEGKRIAFLATDSEAGRDTDGLIFGRRNGTDPVTCLGRDLVADASRLLRTELEPVRARFHETIRHTGIGAALMLGAALLAVFPTAGLFASEVITTRLDPRPRSNANGR